MSGHSFVVKEASNNLSLDDLSFRLRDIELLKLNGNLQIEQQLTFSHVLIIVVNGHGQLTLGTTEYRIQQNHVYACIPGETYGGEIQALDETEIYLLKFEVFRSTDQRYECMVNEKDGRLFSLQGEIQVFPFDQLTSLCKSIFQYWDSDDELERFRSQFTFQKLLYIILKSRSFLHNGSCAALELAKDYMDHYYYENLSIEQLAAIAKISPKYFVDLFKKTYGISAIDYLTELRINKAKQLMAQSHAKLKDIAHQIGYNDEFYFSRKFKKQVGVTPTHYMKRRRRKIAAYRSPITGQLLALKIIPYAAPLHPKWTAYYYKEYRTDISVHLNAYRNGQKWESNIEKLLQAKPEVVISTDDLDEMEKEKLSRVAPIYYIPWQEKNWREQLLLTAEFLGETQEAEDWLKNYDRKVKHAREWVKNKVKDDTFLILRISKQNLYVHCNRSITDILFHDLQLASAYDCNQLARDERMTIDQLIELDPDRLLLLIRQEEETLAYWKTLQYSLPWQELSAVRNNRVYFISSDPWLEYSASAHERIIDEMVSLFSGNRPKRILDTVHGHI